jgi:hypothetical protein
MIRTRPLLSESRQRRSWPGAERVYEKVSARRDAKNLPGVHAFAIAHGRPLGAHAMTFAHNGQANAHARRRRP